MAMLIDSHAHIGHNRFTDDRDEVIARALEAGVEKIVTIGTDVESSREAVTLAEQHPSVYAAVGIHPCDAHLTSPAEWQAPIAELAEHPRVVAIGETGLDYFHPPGVEGMSTETYYQLQAESFQLHLELARKVNKPVVIHQRGECYEDLLELVTAHGEGTHCVFHCWTHGIEKAREVITLGHLISFTGVVTFKNAAEPQEAATEVPDGTFMVETDSPFLAPVPHRGKRCEPAHTAETAAFIANLRGVSRDSLALQTTETAREFFGI